MHRHADDILRVFARQIKVRRGIGQVKEILQPGANDVWVVKRKGKKDLLLPYVPPVVLDVDVAACRIEVELMEGLDDED